jgi:mannose-6-phosphate isomerase-like protein (cupin superfamily)
MAGYTTNIETDTLANRDFRRVLYTAEQMQLVLMTLQPGEHIGMETHEDGDQFFRVEAGEGEAILDGARHPLSDGVVVVIPAGTEHDIINTSRDTPLQVYTIYAPPEHPDATVHATKAEADAYEEAHGH